MHLFGDQSWKVTWSMRLVGPSARSIATHSRPGAMASTRTGNDYDECDADADGVLDHDDCDADDPAIGRCDLEDTPPEPSD